MGSFGLSSVVFGDPGAALGAFGRPLGLHLSPLDSIGAPLGRPWAPFVASGGPLGRRWASLALTLRSLYDQFGFNFALFVSFRAFVIFGIFCKEKKTRHETSQL